MTLKEVMQELEGYGNESTRKVFLNHGAKEPFFGVKVQDLKKITKKVKKDHELSLQLYDTGNSDAMYLAGLIADENKISEKELNHWADKAYWYMISEYTVPWVTGESPHAIKLGLEWIRSDRENIASSGWSTLASYASVTDDEEIDVSLFKDLLLEARDTLHSSQNRVRYTKNGFIISIASYIPELTDDALEVASEVGKVHVDVGGTACKVPLASEYIQKVIDKERVGKKRKTARC